MTGFSNADLISQHTHGFEASFQLFIPAQLIYFKGHFNNLPILPGLVQIKWAIEFSTQLSKRNQIKKINRLKFSGLILPNTTLTLSIHYKMESGRADFRYHNDTVTFSQGQLLYRD